MNIVGTLKRFVKRHRFVPKGADFGVDSFVRRPWLWFNRDAIKVGKNVFIGRESVFHPVTKYAGVSHTPSIKVGDGTYIGGYCQIHAMGRIEIGPECVLSEHVYISDIAHGMQILPTPIMEQPLESKGPVLIGRRVFLGYRVAVLPGVELGDHCIVGTNSVVTRSFPAGSVIAGSPARLMKMRPGFDA
jgi:acetyltransferase-like isoleucine patch superfamily enzyme